MEHYGFGRLDDAQEAWMGSIEQFRKIVLDTPIRLINPTITTQQPHYNNHKPNTLRTNIKTTALKNSNQNK